MRLETERLFLREMTREDFDALWRDYFDLDRDYAALRREFSTDETLRAALAFAPGIRVLRQRPWETLCSYIISQNNNIKRIKGIIARMCESFGEPLCDGRGYAFREMGRNMTGESQPQTLPKLMCFNRCKNVTLEDFTYRRGGAWGCHLCNSDGVTMRRVTCFNHVNATNDGIDIESANVLIEDCDIDADDDAIAVKSESDPSFAVTNVVIRNCRLASMAYPFKIGTGSYGDVRDVRVENCTFPRTKMNHRFPWSKLVTGVTNDISGICGIGLQCVDGGRLENVTVRNVAIEGYGVPLAIRLARRHASPAGRETCLRNILVENVTAVAEGPTASSICGAEGLEIEGVTLRNVRLTLAGGATPADVAEPVANDKGYPGPNMFGSILPSAGLYVRHVHGLVLDRVDFRLQRPDGRPLTDGN